jgi:heterodisulfide reductase subunit B
MKYAYYPGCSLHSTAKEYDVSARVVCQALEIELQEIPGWICCGASSAHMTSRLLSTVLPVKNLILAKELGLDMAVCCAACYSRLRAADKAMSTDEDDYIADVDEIVGSPYRGEVKVKHLLEIMTGEYGLDALREKVTRDLGGLKVAAYYGCLLVRPPEVVAFDEPENPTSMDKLITALGAEAVDWPYKTECCGGSLGFTRTDLVLKLCLDLLQMASDSGAECIMVACPLCQSNLDLRQAQVNKRYQRTFALPILYFTQFVGLALGMDAEELALSKLIVNPKKLLQAKGLI